MSHDETPVQELMAPSTVRVKATADQETAARLLDHLYPDDSWRFMIDLDLLLPPSQIGAAVALLKKAGYVVCDPVGDGKPHHHHPPLVHPARGASVELHRCFGGGLQQRLLAMDEVRARIESRDTPLGRVGLLAPEDQARLKRLGQNGDKLDRSVWGTWTSSVPNHQATAEQVLGGMRGVPTPAMSRSMAAEAVAK